MCTKLRIRPRYFTSRWKLTTTKCSIDLQLKQKLHGSRPDAIHSAVPTQDHRSLGPMWVMCSFASVWFPVVAAFGRVPQLHAESTVVWLCFSFQFPQSVDDCVKCVWKLSKHCWCENGNQIKFAHTLNNNNVFLDPQCGYVHAQTCQILVDMRQRSRATSTNHVKCRRGKRFRAPIAGSLYAHGFRSFRETCHSIRNVVRGSNFSAIQSGCRWDEETANSIVKPMIDVYSGSPRQLNMQIFDHGSYDQWIHMKSSVGLLLDLVFDSTSPSSSTRTHTYARKNESRSQTFLIIENPYLIQWIAYSEIYLRKICGTTVWLC